MSDIRTNRPKRRRALFLAVAVGIAALVIGFIVLETEDADTPSSSDRPSSSSTTTFGGDASTTAERATFSGTGDETTDVFEAAVNWELKWIVSEGETFQVELFAKDGASRGFVVQDDGDSEGSIFVSEAGAFYLEVTTDGRWDVTVIGRPPEAAAEDG